MSAGVQPEVVDLLVGATEADRLDQLRRAGLDDAEGLGRVMERARGLVHDDPRAAETLAALAERAAAGRDLPGVAAQACYLRAQISTERGDLETGLTLVAAARGFWLSAGQPTAALRTDLGRMQILDDLGRHTEALAVGAELVAAAEAVAAAVPADHPDHALARAVRAHAIDNRGTAYGLLGQHEPALAAYAEAEAEYRRLGLVAEAARPLANRGVELLALGRAREAQADLRAAVDGFLAAGDRLFAAKCQGFLGQAHQQLGELFEALDVLSRARATLTELGATAEAVRLQLAIAETYLAIGGWPEARHEAAEAAAVTTGAGMRHDAAMAHYLLASAELGAHDLDAAEAALDRAAPVFAEVQDQQYRARTDLARAEVAAGRGRAAEAVERAESAATALAAGGWAGPQAWAHLRLADLTDGEPSDRHLGQAGSLVEELRQPPLRQAYALRAARRARRSGNLDEAERLLRQATDDLDRSARALSDHALRTAFRADRHAAYDELVATLLDRGGAGDDAAARAAAGAAKAATLRDLTAATVGVGPRLGGTGSELATAYADLGATYSALQDADEPHRRAALAARADRLEERVSALRLRDPPPVAAEGARPDPVDGPAAADADVLTGEFHVTGDDLALFVSGPGGPETHRLSGAVPVVAGLLDQLADQWTRFGLGLAFSDRHGELLLRTARDILAGLFDALLGPVADRLAGAVALRVIPHGLVGQVPFAALYDGRRHLVEHGVLTVSPTPEPAVAAGRVESGDVLVVAVPDPAAPAMGREGAAVAARWPGARLLSGPDATAAAFFAYAPGQGLVHLACHGVYRAANPLFSRLRLADRWVTAAEILHLDLGGALVVLSACESGQHGRSAEPVGLGWAFLAAGAAGVVASQWVVDDETTTQLMTEFYAALTGGQAPAYALRTAQLAVAAERPHPFYWAPFSYVSPPGTTPRSTT